MLASKKLHLMGSASLFLMAIILHGCGYLSPRDSAKSKEPEIVVTPEDMKRAGVLISPQPPQRFLLVGGQNAPGSSPTGSLALDTQTGQLCKTFRLPKRYESWAAGLPLCIDLYSDTEKTLAPLRSGSMSDEEILHALDSQKDTDKSSAGEMAPKPKK